MVGVSSSFTVAGRSPLQAPTPLYASGAAICCWTRSSSFLSFYIIVVHRSRPQPFAGPYAALRIRRSHLLLDAFVLIFVVFVSLPFHRSRPQPFAGPYAALRIRRSHLLLDAFAVNLIGLDHCHSPQPAAASLLAPAPTYTSEVSDRRPGSVRRDSPRVFVNSIYALRRYVISIFLLRRPGRVISLSRIRKASACLVDFHAHYFSYCRIKALQKYLFCVFLKSTRSLQ